MESTMMVSVCMASYNGEKYIKDQVTSILEQLGKDDELIISDDSSIDRTCEIIKSFNDDRIRLLENKSQLGVVKNFELALEVSKGDYIFLSDQDDVWCPKKVETFLQYIETHAIVQSDAVIVDSALATLHPSYLGLTNSKTGLLNNLIKNSYIGCNMAFRREVLKIALPFPSHIPMHDLWIGLIGELFFSTCFISRPLVLYRRHSSNASQTGSKSPFSLTAKIKFRLNVIRYLPLLIKRRYFEQYVNS
jgi:glycosyltransferase involved in cell wall biosynthesis